jgi:hypothetical protein
LFSDNGEASEDQRLLPDLPTYKAILPRWISHVEAAFSSGSDLHREPAIYAVLYRLGQLGHDYAMARTIGKSLVEGGDLDRFMHSTHLAGNFSVAYGNLDIVWNDEELLEIIERDPNNQDRYKKATDLLRSEKAREYFEQRSTKPTAN